ncbi:hypothetical protein; putative signal peptide [Frankia alni ACN14a]|uniref:Uncharacterized protein n=1 Tax=Frankia alni (strain DSM 45986 / CECT 9034 / ACN14a) TaxID=326424 RepID=Q0RLQ4_FRAAA|nr:hypothetical protein; putative signal peptide [Frankia alni ACN14a]
MVTGLGAAFSLPVIPVLGCGAGRPDGAGLSPDEGKCGASRVRPVDRVHGYWSSPFPEEGVPTCRPRYVPTSSPPQPPS